MSDDLFNLPSESKGSGISIASLEGKLIVLLADGEEREVETSIGTSMAAPALVLTVDDDTTGGELQPMLVFSAGIKAQLGTSRRNGKPIVGVVGQGEAAKGKSAPWLLLDPDAKQLTAAREAYTKATAGF